MAYPTQRDLVVSLIGEMVLSPEMLRKLKEHYEEIARRMLVPAIHLGGIVPQRKIAPLPSAGVQVGSIEGWRLWRLEGLTLKSVTMSNAWLPGVPMSGDPDALPTCKGVYAFRDSEDAYRSMMISCCVLGRVKMWGRYVEHERGYRAEFARITDLVCASGANVDLVTLRSLYLSLRCPPELTSVVDPAGRVVGVTTVRPSQPPRRTWSSWLGRYVEDEQSPVTVCEPMEPVTADWLTPTGPTTTVRYQHHRWRGRSLLLEPGQDPTWLPDWLPLPASKGDVDG